MNQPSAAALPSLAHFQALFLLRLELPDDRPLALSGLETLTDAELEAFCRQNPQLRIERAPNGQLLLMLPAHTDSGRRNARLGGSLFKWFEMNPELGEIFDSNTGFTLPDGSMRSPDAAWVSAAKWHALTDQQRKHQFAPICPEFVIELRSGSDSLRDLQRKMMEVWLANGTQLAFLLDADSEMAYVYRAGQGAPEELPGFDRSLSGEAVLPGFVLDLRLLR